MKVALIGCGKSKLNRPAAARDLYTGQLFRATRTWAEANCDQWYILSAKHGLVAPEEWHEPYNVTLNTMSREDRQKWGYVVLHQIWRAVSIPSEIVFLAGRAYREYLIEPLDLQYTVTCPLAHLGIGQQIAWLLKQAQAQMPLL